MTTGQLPESLIVAIRNARVLPVVGGGSKELIPEPQWIERVKSQHQSVPKLAAWHDSVLQYMQPLYDTVAALFSHAVLALTADRHLIRILAADPRSLCVENTQVAYDEARRLVISLAGNTDHPARVIMRESDWFEISERAPLLWELARSHAARSPLLLLGCDPGDPYLKQVIGELRSTL